MSTLQQQQQLSSQSIVPRSSQAVAAEERLNKRLDAELATLEAQLAHIVGAAALRFPTSSGQDADGAIVATSGAGAKGGDGSGSGSTAPVKDRYKVAQEHHLMLGAAANMIHSAESLLSLTLDIKRALLLNDFRTLNSTVRGRYLTLQDARAVAKDALVDVRDEMREVVEALEAARDLTVA